MLRGDGEHVGECVRGLQAPSTLKNGGGERRCADIPRTFDRSQKAAAHERALRSMVELVDMVERRHEDDMPKGSLRESDDAGPAERQRKINLRFDLVSQVDVR